MLASKTLVRGKEGKTHIGKEPQAIFSQDHGEQISYKGVPRTVTYKWSGRHFTPLSWCELYTQKETFSRYTFGPIRPHWLSDHSLFYTTPKQILHFHQYLTKTFERKIITMSFRESSLKATNPVPNFPLTGHKDACTCSPRQAAKHTALSSRVAVKDDASPALL